MLGNFLPIESQPSSLMGYKAVYKLHARMAIESDILAEQA